MMEGDREKAGASPAVVPARAAAPGQPGRRRPLQVLLIEDSEDDADLVLLELRRLGYLPEFERVEKPDELEAALGRSWDLIICDYNLPGFNAPSALAMVRRRQSDVPFLVVSGTTSETQAVHTLLAGAQDFFNKGSLTRLGPAIDRELKEAEGRRARRFAESALKSSEQRFQEVIENVSDLIVLLSAEGVIRYSSPSVQRILGYSPGELEGRRMAELAAPDGRAFMEFLEEARRGGEEGRTRELVLLRKDGKPVLLDVGAKDANAKRLGFILNARDITLRRETEKALARTEERLHMAVEAGRLGTWYMDVARSAIEINARGREHVGWDPDEAVTLPAFYAKLHPDHRERTRLAVEAALAGGIEYNVQFRLLDGADGGPRWVHSIGKVFEDDQGRPSGFYGVTLDITEAKRAEMLLMETQQRLRAALLGSNAGTFKLDPASGAMDCDANLRSLLRVDAGTSLDHWEDFLSYLQPEEREWVAEGLLDAVRNGRELDEEFRVRGAGGDHRWIAVKGMSFAGGDGAPSYLMGACIDITERRQALEQLRQSQKMEAIGRLAGGIAHDFNNLLTAINGYADLCIDRTDAGHELHLPLREIRKAGSRAASLTHQLLAYSRKQVLMPKVVSLDEIVKDMETMLTRLIGENIRVVTRFDAGPALVKVDPGQMHQVLVNLAVNARDAMPKGGELVLETSRRTIRKTGDTRSPSIPPGEYVTLKVTDTGCGMAPEVLSKIFEPFFTTKPVGKGTGLGLSMVYGMVRQSGGHVTVDSVPGSGTTFSIFLPAVAAEAPTPAAAAGPAGEAGGGRGVETILLVEDEDSVLNFLSTVLRMRDYTVVAFKDPAEALEAVSGGLSFDLLLTDMVMAGMSGRELAARLREIRPDLRALFISGYSEDELTIRSLEHPADFLQKPFTSVSMLERVRSVLDMKAPAGRPPQ